MKHKTKRNLAGSLMIIIFLMGFIIPAYIQADYLNFDQLTETQPVNILDQGFESDSETINNADPETKQSVIDYDKFYLSESVLTEIEFNPSTINFDSVVSAWDINLFASRIYGYSLVYIDDNYYLKFEQRFDPDAELVEQRHSFKIYAGGSGTLYYTDLHAWISDGAAQTSSTTSRSGSLSVTNAMLDAQGYLLISIISYAYIGNYININFAYLTSAGSNTIVYQNNALSVIPDIDSHEIRFDVLYFQRDKIVNTIRSEHKYASAFTMINKKIIPSVPHAKEITVNLMEDETVTSVNPSASWSVSSNVLTISSPVELNYEVLTSRTCSNHLAIKDVSSAFLTNVGFEDGKYQDDWYLMDGELSTDISIATNIVSDGYYSLRVDKDSTSDYLILRMFNHKYYNTYVSFDIYYNSRTAGDYLQLAYHDYTSWLFESLEFETDRWYKCFFYLDYVQNVEFYSKASTDVFDVYVDNFRIFQTSTSITTQGYSDYYMTSQLIAWDGYKNPLLEGQQTLNTTLLERSSQTSIYSTNLTSTTGLFELEYGQALEQKEYEIWTYSYSSGEFNNCSFYFTPSYPHQIDYAETELNDAWDFAEGDNEGATSDGSVTITNGTYKTDGFTATEQSVIDFTEPDFDGTYYTDVIIRIRANDSVDIQGYTNEGYFTAWLQITTAWQTLDLVGYGNPYNDWDSSVQELRFLTKDTHGYPCYFEIDFIEIVHIDSFLDVTNDYATDELYDAWDFEEGDTDGNTATGTVTNGYFEATVSDTYTPFIEFLNLNFDATSYSTPYICIYVEDTFIFQLFTENGWISNNMDVTPKEWNIIEIDINRVALWEASSTSIILYAQTSSSLPQTIKVNWFRLIHSEELPYSTIQNSVLLESETNDLQYNLYLDYNFVGTFPDLSLIPLLSTVGTHYLQVQPFRTDEAYITQQIFSYYYRVSLVDNYYLYLDYDYDLLGSINLIIDTFWGNQTIDVWHNSTQLLNDEAEGDITTFYEVSEGYHKITVKVYNGAVLWDEFVFGFKIVLPDAIENYYLVFDSPFIDAAAGLVYLSYETYWGNCTYRLKDNSTWCGTAVNEGSSVWDFYPNYGFHNFSVYVYQGEDVWDIIPFGLTLAAPETEYNYYLDLGYDYDLLGSLNILLFTYWGNMTLDIYDNSTLLVDDSPEGDITTLYSVVEGYHNISIEVYNSASLWDTLYFGFYIVIPDPIENYYLDLGYSYDLSGSLNVWIYTYWGNQTVDIFDNSTQVVDGVSEGDITTIYLVVEGYHNITVDLYNGASLWDSLEFGFIISSDIEIYTVHLDLFDQGGLGVTFSEVKCYMDSINDTNRLPQDFLTLDQNFTLYVTDYFNVTLTYFDVTLNYTLSTNYVDVEILLYEAEFKNRYNFAVSLEIVRNYHSHSFTLNANQTILFWLTAGNYTVTASPLVNEEYDSYSEIWTTTSEIKQYRIYLDPKPVTVKKPINVVAFVIFIVQAGAIAGGLTFAYMNIYKPLRKEFFGFNLKNAFKHKKKQTWTTIVIAIIALAMGGLYTLGG